jgi:hypothetical protein
MGREPDAAGLQTFVVNIEAGMPYEQALANFLGSDEYYVKKGNTPEAFIVGLYRDLLNRDPNSEELRIQLDQLYGSGARNNYTRNFLIATRSDRANRRFSAPPPPPVEEGRYQRPYSPLP